MECFHLLAILLRRIASVGLHEAGGFHFAIEAQPIRSGRSIQNKIKLLVFFDERVGVGDFGNPPVKLHERIDGPLIFWTSGLGRIGQFFVQISIHETRCGLRHFQQVAPDGLLLNGKRPLGQIHNARHRGDKDNQAHKHRLDMRTDSKARVFDGDRVGLQSG